MRWNLKQWNPGLDIAMAQRVKKALAGIHIEAVWTCVVASFNYQGHITSNHQGKESTLIERPACLGGLSKWVNWCRPPQPPVGGTMPWFVSLDCPRVKESELSTSKQTVNTHTFILPLLLSVDATLPAVWSPCLDFPPPWTTPEIASQINHFSCNMISVRMFYHRNRT